MENSKLKLILASASPRRKELLGHVGIPFEIMTENVPEESDFTNPIEFCRHIAQIKGAAVSSKLRARRLKESFVVISADTIVELSGRIFNKPSNKEEARDFLNILSGRTHSVFTAVCMELITSDHVLRHSFVDESRVTFDKIGHEIMERYLDTGDSLDKAGAYGIQGPSLTFISKVEGSYSNVVGFPLSRFIVEIEKFLKESFPKEEVWQNLF